MIFGTLHSTTTALLHISSHSFNWRLIGTGKRASLFSRPSHIPPQPCSTTFGLGSNHVSYVPKIPPLPLCRKLLITWRADNCIGWVNICMSFITYFITIFGASASFCFVLNSTPYDIIWFIFVHCNRKSYCAGMSCTKAHMETENGTQASQINCQQHSTSHFVSFLSAESCHRARLLYCSIVRFYFQYTGTIASSQRINLLVSFARGRIYVGWVNG